MVYKIVFAFMAGVVTISHLGLAAPKAPSHFNLPSGERGVPIGDRPGGPHPVKIGDPDMTGHAPGSSGHNGGLYGGSSFSNSGLPPTHTQTSYSQPSYSSPSTTYNPPPDLRRPIPPAPNIPYHASDWRDNLPPPPSFEAQRQQMAAAGSAAQWGYGALLMMLARGLEIKLQDKSQGLQGKLDDLNGVIDRMKSIASSYESASTPKERGNIARQFSSEARNFSQKAGAISDVISGEERYINNDLKNVQTKAATDFCKYVDEVKTQFTQVRADINKWSGQFQEYHSSIEAQNLQGEVDNLLQSFGAAHKAKMAAKHSILSGGSPGSSPGPLGPGQPAPGVNGAGWGTAVRGQCFTGDTMVCLTNIESRPIEKIQEGDQIITFNQEMNQLEYREVTRRYENTVHELVRLSYLGKVVRVTPEHPYFTINRGWVEAKDLVPSEDQLQGISGDPIVLEDKDEEAGTFHVYNLEVEGTHTYYACDALVHNCNSTVAVAGMVLSQNASALASQFLPNILSSVTAVVGPVVGPVLMVGSAALGAYALHQMSQSNDDSSGDEVKPKSSNQMQKEVERGQAPKTIERVDKGVDRPGLKEKPHIHLDDGSALNNDGTWKHGGRALTEAEKKWISKSGWKLPHE